MDALHTDHQRRVRFLVAQHAIFGSLSEPDIADLTDRLTTQRALAGDVIFRQGDPGESVFIVMAGRVKLSITGDNGRVVTLEVLRTGAHFGEVATFDRGPSTATATAIYPTTLLVLARADLERYLAERPELALRMLSGLSRRLRRADETIAELALCDVPERLMRRLHAIARQEGREAPRGLLLQRPPTHQDLANMVGSCRETVCRALKELVRKGLLISEGKTLLVAHPLIAAT